jgi:hypothetical protein
MSFLVTLHFYGIVKYLGDNIVIIHIFSGTLYVKINTKLESSSLMATCRLLIVVEFNKHN